MLHLSFSIRALDLICYFFESFNLQAVIKAERWSLKMKAELSGFKEKLSLYSSAFNCKLQLLIQLSSKVFETLL